MIVSSIMVRRWERGLRGESMSHRVWKVIERLYASIIVRLFWFDSEWHHVSIYKPLKINDLRGLF
jgi:hypothetical protein